MGLDSLAMGLDSLAMGEDDRIDCLPEGQFVKVTLTDIRPPCRVVKGACPLVILVKFISNDILCEKKTVVLQNAQGKGSRGSLQERKKTTN